MAATKRIINSIFFDKDAAECSLTSLSQGGPASGMQTILLKTKQPMASDLSAQETEILKAIGEEFTPLRKQGINDKPSSSIQSDVGEDNNLTKGNEMSDNENAVLIKAMKDELISLKKSLKQKDLEKYSFENSEAVADILVTLEDKAYTDIIKAFDQLTVVSKDLEKTLETKEDLEKSADKELGLEGEAELEKAEEPPTQVSLIKSAIQAKRNKAENKEQV
jgi:hypothetical protein